MRQSHDLSAAFQEKTHPRCVQAADREYSLPLSSRYTPSNHTNFSSEFLPQNGKLRQNRPHPDRFRPYGKIIHFKPSLRQRVVAVKKDRWPHEYGIRKESGLPPHRAHAPVSSIKGGMNKFRAITHIQYLPISIG